MRSLPARRAVPFLTWLLVAGFLICLGGCAPGGEGPRGAPAETRVVPTASPTAPPPEAAPRATVAMLLPTATTQPTPTVTVTVTPTASPTGAQPESPTPEPTSTGEGVIACVVEVYDGDTIAVEIAGERHDVRYIGVDAPEPGQGYRDFQWLGQEAGEFNCSLVDRQVVRLERDTSEVDRYGRLLRYVWVGEMFVNAELVRLGYAEARAYPPDVRHHELFERLQADAQAAQRGIWAPRPTETPTPEIGGADCPYVGNANTGKFHHAWCSSVEQMAPHNLVCLPSREEAIAQGYEPCRSCKP